MELAEIQDQQLMELPLFDQIDRNDIRPMLTCLGAFVRASSCSRRTRKVTAPF